MNRLFSVLAVATSTPTRVALILPLLLALAGVGCQKSNPNPRNPFVFPGQTPAGPGESGLDQYVSPTTAELRPGETITVSFSDLPLEARLLPLEVRVGEDGKVTLYHNITVVAAGKTTTQLQEDIRNAYVPKLFKRLTVTVKGADLLYFVGGEVRNPTRQPYVGHMTVLRAISTAGGFTEYADKTGIELIRSTGETFKVNGKKAIKHPELDLEVLPNDWIYVPRRSF